METNPKKLRTRSPAYPYLDLRSALEKAAVLLKAEGRHPAVVNVVMHHWGYTEESSTGHSCLAALKKFGLIEHDGMGGNKQIRLSNLALAILQDENPDSPARQEALRAAALGPRIHTELWERYGSDLPSDQSLKRHLVLEKNFNEAAVAELLEEYKQTIAFAGLNLTPPPNPAALVPASPPVRRATPDFSEEPSRAAWRDEAPPAPILPPARAIGPAGGTGGGNGESTAPARSLPGRVPPSYDQDDFGYDAGPRAIQSEPASRATPAGGRGSAATPQFPANMTAGEASTSAPRKELPVPLDGDRVALVPYPMTEEDFGLLIDTLQLWKKRLVRAGE